MSPADTWAAQTSLKCTSNLILVKRLPHARSADCGLPAGCPVVRGTEEYAATSESRKGSPPSRRSVWSWDSKLALLHLTSPKTPAVGIRQVPCAALPRSPARCREPPSLNGLVHTLGDSIRRFLCVVRRRMVSSLMLGAFRERLSALASLLSNDECGQTRLWLRPLF